MLHASVYRNPSPQHMSAGDSEEEDETSCAGDLEEEEEETDLRVQQEVGKIVSE